MAAQEEVVVRRKERRKTLLNPAGNPLLWCKWVSFLFWSMGMYFAQNAKPADESFFHRIMNMGVARNWNRDLLTLSWFFLWLTALVAIGGLILNGMRLRRKDDHLSVALLLVVVVTLFSMAVLPAGNSIATFLMHLKN